jgi:hypothetical protein
MASLMEKLGIRARLGLATIPELGAWSTPSVETRVNGSAPLYPLSGNGREVDPQNMAHLWREIASGYWSVRAGVDAGGLRHAVMVRDSPRTSIGGRSLGCIERCSRSWQTAFP